MMIRARVLWKTAVLVAILVLPVQIVLIAALSSPDIAESRAAWVASLSDGEVASVAAEISTYPVEVRRAVMKRLSPSQRAAVWTTHLQAYLDRHPNLAAGTRAQILVAKGLVSRIHGSGTRNEAELSELDSIARQLKAKLGDADAKELINLLGPANDKIQPRESLPTRVLAFVRQAFIASAFVPECQCSSVSDWCGDLYVCKKDALNCAHDPWGFCGSWGAYTCDGLCDLIVPTEPN